MQMRDRIGTALKEAMKSKDQIRLSTLRLINAAIKDREIALRTAGEAVEIGDGEILAIMGKMVKQRQESARAYEEGGRLELAEKELAEAEVIGRYLPAMLSETELDSIVGEEVAAVEASSGEKPTMRQMGAVIKAVNARVFGRAEGATVAAKVKAALT